MVHELLARGFGFAGEAEDVGWGVVVSWWFCFCFWCWRLGLGWFSGLGRIGSGLLSLGYIVGLVRGFQMRDGRGCGAVLWVICSRVCD